MAIAITTTGAPAETHALATLLLAGMRALGKDVNAYVNDLRAKAGTLSRMGMTYRAIEAAALADAITTLAAEG